MVVKKSLTGLKYKKSNPRPCYMVPRADSHDNWKKIFFRQYVLPFSQLWSFVHFRFDPSERLNIYIFLSYFNVSASWIYSDKKIKKKRGQAWCVKMIELDSQPQYWEYNIEVKLERCGQAEESLREDWDNICSIWDLSTCLHKGILLSMASSSG